MKINELANANQESGFKPFDGIDELIKFIKEKFNEYKVDKTIREKKQQMLKDLKVKDLKEIFENVNNDLDKQEQYSRRDCLLVHELDESKNNIADTLVIELMK